MYGNEQKRLAGIYYRVLSTLFCFFCLGGLAQNITIRCGNCNNQNCFQVHSLTCVECLECQQSYSPACVVYSFRQALAVGHVDGLLEITLRDCHDVAGAFGFRTTMRAFSGILTNHQRLLHSVVAPSVMVIPPQLVELLWIDMQADVAPELAIQQAHQAIIVGILLVLNTHPEYLREHGLLTMVASAIVVRIYNNSLSYLHYMHLVEGFQPSAQPYQQVLANLRGQINPPRFIEVEPGDGPLSALPDVFSCESNGCYIFLDNNLGLSALLLNNGQWTLILGSGLIVTAPRVHLMVILALAQLDALETIQRIGAIVGQLPFMGIAIGAGAGAVIATADFLPSPDLVSVGAAGAIAGGILGGLLAVGYYWGRAAQQRRLSQESQAGQDDNEDGD